MDRSWAVVMKEIPKSNDGKIEFKEISELEDIRLKLMEWSKIDKKEK